MMLNEFKIISIFILMSILFYNTFCSDEYVPTLDCADTKFCLPHQTCIHGYCFCDEGYVRHNISCFKVKKYGQSCYFDEQCPDHRMNCMKQENSKIDTKYCLCNKFHLWNKTLQECIPAFNIKKMLMEYQEKTDLQAKLGADADRIFSGVLVAGSTVVILGSLFAMICILYGCCLRRCLFTKQLMMSNKEKIPVREIRRSTQICLGLARRND